MQLADADGAFDPWVPSRLPTISRFVEEDLQHHVDTRKISALTLCFSILFFPIRTDVILILCIS